LGKGRNETRSPKFDFINSVIFVFSSSGKEMAAAGFAPYRESKRSRENRFMATVRLNLTSRICNSFIESRLQISPQSKASPAKSTVFGQYRSRPDKNTPPLSLIYEIVKGRKEAAKSARDTGSLTFAVPRLIVANLRLPELTGKSGSSAIVDPVRRARLV